MLSYRFDDALAYASQIHRLQRRKGTEIPYVSHLLAVSALVIENGGDEVQAIAALLHDAAEDQGGADRLREIDDRFGPDVATIVSDCTDAWTDPKPPWRERKEHYVAQLSEKSPRSLLVSLADKTHNAGAMLADHRELGPLIWSRFTGAREGTLWYYDALTTAFFTLMPGRLARQLRLTVSELARCE